MTKRFWGFLAIVALASCVSDTSELSLDEADAAEDTSYRLNVRVRTGDGETETEVELTPAQFSLDVRQSCIRRLVGPVGGASTHHCERQLEEAWVAYCTASTLLDLAGEGAGTTLEYRAWTLSAGYQPASYFVLPQSPGTRAGLAAASLQQLDVAVDRAYLGLLDPALAGTDDPPLGVCSLADLEQPAPFWNNPDEVGTALATLLVEAYGLIGEAHAESVHWGSSVADAQFSTVRDYRNASRMAWVAPELSRSWLGRITVGGSGGLRVLPDASEAGFCPTTRLGAPAERALEILRLTAPPPAVIADEENVSIGALLVGGWPLVADPESSLRTVASRLARLWRVDLSGIATAADLLEYLGLSQQDFVEARRYLRFEHEAFGRSFDAIVPEQSIPYVAALGFRRFAGVATEPSRAPSSFYQSVARFGQPAVVESEHPTIADLRGAVPPAMMDVEHAYDLARTSAYVLFRQDAESTADLLSPPVRDILARFLPEASDSVRGRVWACDTYGRAALRLRIYGANASSGLAAVAGPDGLSCAIRGAVEGAPCDLASYLIPTTATVTPAPVESGYDEALDLTVDYDDLGERGTVAMVYLVELRRSGAVAAPGAFAEYSGMPIAIPELSGEALLCNSYPVIDLTRASIGEILSPSPSFCALVAASCSGVPFDQELPLEDELSDDHDGIEDSWSRYLTQAESAANFADALGEEMIRAGEQLDERSERFADALEDACGVRIDLESTLSPHTRPSAGPCGPGDTCDDGYECDAGTCIRTGPATVLGACGPGDTCGTPGYRCEADTCVLDPVEYAVTLAAGDVDAARLRACLGNGGVYESVALGAANLCYTVDPATQALCLGLANDVCPRECETPGPDERRTDRFLGYFLAAPPSPTTDDDVPAPPTPPCDALRELRSHQRAGTTSGAAARAALARVREGWFRLVEIENGARRLGYEPYPGDYSAVTRDLAPWFGTGDFQEGNLTDTWPCTPTSGRPVACPPSEWYSDPADSGSIWCLQNVCGTSMDPTTPAGDYHAGRVLRARVNDRFARAVLAARIFSGVGVSGVRSVFYPRLRDHDFSAGAPIEFVSPGFNTVIRAEDGRPLQRTRGGAISIEGGEGELILDELGRGAAWRLRPLAGDPVAPWGSTACAVIPRSAEWSYCPYNRAACVEIFDDGPGEAIGGPNPPGLDCDDYGLHYDYNLPMVVRAYPAGLDGFRPGDATPAFWGGLGSGERPADTARFGGDVSRLLECTDADCLQGISYGLRAPSEGAIEDLSLYWRRFGCGEGFTRHYEGRCLEAYEPPHRVCYSDTDSGCSGRVGSTQDYEDAVRDAEDNFGNLDYTATFDGNRAFVAPDGLDGTSVLDAMELICAVGLEPSLTGEGTPCDLSMPPVVRTVRDLNRVADYFECLGARVNSDAARTIFRDFPVAAYDALRVAGSRGAASGTGGEYGTQVSQLRAAVVQLSSQRGAIAEQMRGTARDLRGVRAALDGLAAQDEILDLELASTVADQITRCGLAVADAIGWDDWGAGASAAMSCINSLVQIGLAARIGDLRGDVLDTERVRLLNGIEESLDLRASAIGDAQSLIRTSAETIDAQLAGLSSTRAIARRALSRALFAGTDAAATSSGLDTALGRRYETTRQRYHAAHRTAVRLAYLAKLAIEQRLGMPMDTLTDPMPLLDSPPAEWHMSVCSSTGIDYARIRAAGVASEEIDDPRAELDGTYAGEFIGDYVRRLGLLVEAYRLQYPFQAGTDTSVVSLRDDIFAIRSECAQPSPNLLQAGDLLDVRATPEVGGWIAAGCADPLDDDCVQATVSSYYTSPIPYSAADLGRPPVYDLTFGDPDGPTPATRLTPTSAYQQNLTLERGVWRVSWYERIGAAPDVAVLDGAANLVNRASDRVGTRTVGPGWQRVFALVDVPTSRTLSLAVLRPSGVSSAVRYAVAGFMLENVTGVVAVGAAAAAHPPRGYYAPGDRVLPVCEDTEGDAFRASAWEYRCERLCEHGYGGDCVDLASRPQCFWETSFTLDQRAIERGELIRAGGFAYGNFNYRVDSVGVNIVGTFVRDCERARLEGYSSPTCYASGSVPFSLLHTGPFTVRNHRGQPYDAPLFPGRIEHARALAAERYVTNPISSADRALLDPYLRAEFRGRPLTGRYALRIWDEPGVTFSSITDVQVVLNYRYWTRQE